MIRLFDFCLLLTAFLLSAGAAAAADPPTDLSSDISAALQQRSEAAILAGRVARLAAGGEYQEAENNLRRLLQARPLGTGGQRLLEQVYYRLSTMEQLRAWNRWCTSRPTSHFPYLVRGMYFLERARFLDGANKSLLLSARQRGDFRQFLISGRTDLEKAAELSDADPGPAAALTALSIHLKLPRIEMEKWFQRAVDIDPGWLAAYRAKLLYLSPWWYGSEQMMEQFARKWLEIDSAAANTYIVVLDYLKLRADRMGPGLQTEQFLLAPETYRMLTDAVDRYVVDYPHSPALNVYLGLMERALAEPYVAVAAFTSTLNNNADDIAARKGRIRAYLDNRQFREAENDLVYLEQLMGETGFSRFHLGIIAFQSSRDIDRAHQFIEAAIELEKSSFRRKSYYYKRAEFYRQRGRQPEAITDYSAAIEEDLLFEQAYFGRAQSRYALGDLEGGLADLVIIKSTIKGRMTAKARALINTYLSKPVDSVAAARSGGPETSSPSNGRLAPAPKQDSAAGLNYDYREFLIRGLRLYYKEEIEASRRDFYRVISYKPDNATAYFMLGEIAARHDFDQVEACLFFREAHRLAPDTPDYLIELSRCLYREHNYSDTIDLLSAFINNSESSDITNIDLAQIYFLRGSCLEKSGLRPEALEDMLQALALNPEHEAAAEFIRNQTAGPKKGTKTSP